MLNRLILGSLLLFWGVMMTLLWRSEFGQRGNSGGSVPIETVWQRALLAPNSSQLEIQFKGKRIGTCHWTPTVNEAATTAKKPATNDEPLEGAVTRIGGYTLDIDGTVNLPQGNTPYRFDGSLRFSTNGDWREFQTRVQQRPNSWEVGTSAIRQDVRVKIAGADGAWDRTITFEELRHPEKLLAEFGAPWAMGLLGGFGIPKPDSDTLSLGLAWQANYDWFQFGRVRLRAYRVSARLLNRYQAVIYLSRAGEILRMELPNDVTLINEAFLTN